MSQRFNCSFWLLKRFVKCHKSTLTLNVDAPCNVRSVTRKSDKIRIVEECREMYARDKFQSSDGGTNGTPYTKIAIDPHYSL